MSVPVHHAVFGAWLAASVFVGCAGANASAQRQLEEMRREIHEIQSDNDRLNERVTALELASAGPSEADQPGEDDRPELEVVRLSPDEPPDDLGGRMEAPQDPPQDPDAPPTVIRAEGDRVPSVRRGSRPSKGALDAKASTSYDRALDLVKRKRYEAALEAFAGFLVRYPGHPHADNAMYWRGECHYAMGNYVRAAEQFEGLISRFPYGNKLPDALLKLGLSLRRMGEHDKAAKAFEQLRKSYPKSDAAGKIPRE